MQKEEPRTKATLFLIGIIFLTSTALLGQVDLYEPIYLELGHFASALNIPEDFLPFVADSTVQILFNPARASDYHTNFIYANYAPISNTYASRKNVGVRVPIRRSTSDATYPTISFAMLLGTPSTKWLLQFENGISNQDYQDEGDYEETYLNSGYYNHTLEVFHDDKKVQASTTRFRSTMIKNSGSIGYAVGIFGIYNHSTSVEDYVLNRMIHGNMNYDENHWMTNIWDQSYMTNFDTQDSKYTLGIEFGTAGPDWNLTSTISYQRSNKEDRIIDAYHYADMDSSYYSYPDTAFTYTFIRNRTTHFESDIHQNPNILAWKTYFQKKSRLLFNNDYIFLSLNGAYALNSDIPYHYLQTQEESYERSGEIKYDNQMQTSGKGTEKGNSQKIRISTGYVISLTKENLSFFAGLNPIISHRRSKSLLSQSERADYSNYYYAQSLFYEDLRTWECTARIPVYLNYHPRACIAFFGGINYTYTYSRIKADYRTPEMMTEILPEETTNHLDNTTRTTSVYSNSQFYLGMSLSHQSGFICHIAFNGTATSYRNWYVSLGYHF